MIDIISVTYGHNNNLKCFINSIKSQTNSNWRLYVIHDGLNEELKLDLEKNDYLLKNKIFFIEYPKRTGNYGHLLRKWGLETFVDSEYVLITNGDNYYTPNMVNEVLKNKNDFVYFDCVHSHKNKNNSNGKDYGYMNTKLKRGCIDMGCVVLKSSIAKKIGFNSTHFAADWFFFEEGLKEVVSIKKIDKILLVHN